MKIEILVNGVALHKLEIGGKHRTSNTCKPLSYHDNLFHQESS